MADFFIPLNLSVLTCKLKGMTVVLCKVERTQGRHAESSELGSYNPALGCFLAAQPLSLSAFLHQGAVPFLVIATSGTTVLGAFDPLEAIADVCQRRGLWLHVDVSRT